MTPSVTQTLFDRMQSHALASGLFERVNTHEPKNPPGKGLTCSIWVDQIGPDLSGLSATSPRVTFNVRIYQNMISEPQDAIDPNVLAACATLMDDYTGDFTLGGAVRTIDLLGAGGTPMQAQAGYINQAGQMMRVMTISVPAIVNDSWTQTA